MKNVIILLLLFSLGATAQSKRGDYCSCKEADKLNNTVNYYPDSLYAIYKEDTAAITITIINTTKDTLYIFNSYLQQQFISSKYIHRIDLHKRLYKVSFLPIVPYVFTKYSDVIITKDAAIIGNHQVVYDFFKLPPNSNQEIELKYQQLFNSRNKNNNASKDYDVKKLNKNSKISTNFYTTNKLTGKYNLIFEFAVYKSVDLLCKQSAYYLQEYKFDKQSKNFKILIVPVKVRKYHYPLIK